MCATKSPPSGIARFNAAATVDLDISRRRVDVQLSAAPAPKIIALLLIALRTFVLPRKSVLTAAALNRLHLLSALIGCAKKEVISYTRAVGVGSRSARMSVCQASKVTTEARGRFPEARKVVPRQIHPLN